jgi:PAS domain S-box-containing protein
VIIMMLQPRDDAEDLDGVEQALGAGEPQRVGWFRFHLDGQRWEWSDTVARLHGYAPEDATPTTDLLLRHKHPEDRGRVAAALDEVADGQPFSSRHRIVDTTGRTHWVIVVGDRTLDEAGAVTGTAGFYVDITDTLSRVSATRAEIEQAKGLIMAAYGINADRAFDILVWRSQQSNVKVRDVARRFLAAMAGGMSQDTRTRVDHALLDVS